MKVVQPIRDIEKLEEIMADLNNSNERDYIMFMLGIWTGLRISDILKLKVKDVKGSHIRVWEQKTDKEKKTIIVPDLKKALFNYIVGKPDNEYLIKSRKGKNKPIRRETAYTILNNAAKRVKLKEIGTHTLRKTFGYHFYQQTKDVAMLQDLFNHASPAITLRYIGVNQDGRDKAMLKFKYKSTK